MIRAPQFERRKRQNPKRVRRRSSAGAASQMRGRINLDAFPRGITVAGRSREMPDRGVPDHRAEP
jgi:hypothetical protein